MAVKIIEHGSLQLSAADREHLEALAAKRGWDEIEDFYVFSPLEQPPMTPERAERGYQQLKERGLLDNKRVS